MPSRKVWLLAFFGAVGMTAGLGFLAYPVTEPVQRWGQKLIQNSGWTLSIGQAQWVPWRSLDLADLKLKTGGGGRLHVVRIHIVPQPFSLLRGYLATQWEVGEIRMDPGSWGIRKPLAQEILSSGPVSTSGTAHFSVHPNRIELERLALGGPLLSLHGEGRWLNGSRLHMAFRFQGKLSRLVLKSLNLYNGFEEGDLWEPFQGRLESAMGRVCLSFDSNFFRYTTSHGEGS